MRETREGADTWWDFTLSREFPLARDSINNSYPPLPSPHFFMQPSRPQHFTGAHLYPWWRETLIVKCFAQEHNTMKRPEPENEPLISESESTSLPVYPTPSKYMEQNGSKIIPDSRQSLKLRRSYDGSVFPLLRILLSAPRKKKNNNQTNHHKGSGAPNLGKKTNKTK